MTLILVDSFAGKFAHECASLYNVKAKKITKVGFIMMVVIVLLIYRMKKYCNSLRILLPYLRSRNPVANLTPTDLAFPLRISLHDYF